MFQAAHFGEELVAQDANVRPGQAGGGEDVDHLTLGGNCLVHKLADGVVDLLGSFFVATALLVPCGLQGLEETHVVADVRGLVAGGAECESAREFGYHLHPATKWLSMMTFMVWLWVM